MTERIVTTVLERSINGNHYELVETRMDCEDSLRVFNLKRNSKPIRDPRTTFVYFSLMDTIAYDLSLIYSDDEIMRAELLAFLDEYRLYDDAKELPNDSE